MARLALSFLGTFQVFLDSEPVTGFESNKVRALLAYLVLEADRPHSREALSELLWPNLTGQASRSNLRQALANLRLAIGDENAEQPFLNITRESIQFNLQASVWSDVAAFHVFLSACEMHTHRQAETCKSCVQWLDQAANLYHGDFLEHFYVGGSPAFEDWALVKREGLHHQALNVMTRLADYHNRCGNHEKALQYANHQLQLDPNCEEAHRLAIRALACSGQRNAALVQYETCRRVLEQEYGVTPGCETQALYEQIKAGAGMSSPCLPDREYSLNNLPPQTTTFIGRQAELAQISELLGRPACRLLTLLGPGGIGKTRLALEVAYEHAGMFADGITFVSLPEVASIGQIVKVIAEALDFLSPQQWPCTKAQLLSYLRQKEMLLILDNVEYLLPHPSLQISHSAEANLAEGLQLVNEILQQAPRVILLVTSTERLFLRAEWVFDLHGLPYPSETDDGNLRNYEAVQLFLLHAKQINRKFSLSPGEAEALARICRLVGGMPLAIELAASAVRTRSCFVIANEIENNLRMLSTIMKDVPNRHRSMWATFEHSWQRLSPEERATFRRLSVFRGGFQEGYAIRITGATSPLLLALVEKSLLCLDMSGRYDLHPLERQFTAEKLLEAGEVDFTRDRHLSCFAALVKQAEHSLDGPDRQAWLEKLEVERENLREAWKWACTRKKTHLAARLERFSRF